MLKMTAATKQSQVCLNIAYGIRIEHSRLRLPHISHPYPIQPRSQAFYFRRLKPKGCERNAPCPPQPGPATKGGYR